MSEVDPNKMKVVELRSELSTRGLDTKGNKAVLVRRLKTAMDKEAGAIAGDENGTVDYEDDGKNDESMDAEDEILKDEDGLEDDEQDEAENEKSEIKPEDLDEELENIEKAENDEESKENDDEKAEKTDGKAEVENMDSTTDEAKKAKDSSSDKKKDEPRGQKRRRSRSRDKDQKAEKKEEKFEIPPLEDLEEFDANKVILDLYVSDLNLKLDETRCSATPLHANGFSFMWAGAKACYGYTSGKICYEVKVTKHEDVKHLPAEEANPHVVRVGVSDRTSGLQLGEEALSFGYGGTGKFSSDCKFEDYGKTFKEGDVVQCFVNMDAEPIELSYSVNGEHLGVAKTIAKEDLKESPLFPHILTKNCTFEVNFGQKEEPFFPLPEGYEDYQFVQAVDVEQRVRGPVCPEKKEDCEMIMMCGLPGAGKTHWATNHSKTNPDKMYNILGTNSIIDKMKVMGLPRKRNYHGRWDVLIEKSTSCLNKMFDIAFRRRRNYILDQTNVYASAQRRKMRPFEGFQRKAVVIVPTDDEFKARIAKRTKEEGKDVPDHAVLEMKASFTLPKVGDWFSSVEFTELAEEEAQKLVDQYRKEGQAAAPRKRFRRDDRHRDRRSGDRRNFGRNRGPGGPNRNRGGPGGGNRSWNQGSGGGNRNWNQGGQGNRNWGSGGSRNSSQGSRNWGPPSGGNPGRRSWGASGQGYRDGGRDNYRGPPSRSPSRYNMPPARYQNSRPAPPSRGYGGYNQNSQQSYQNYPQQQGQWNQQWGSGSGSGGGGGQWNPYPQYYQQQNQGYYK